MKTKKKKAVTIKPRISRAYLTYCKNQLEDEWVTLEFFDELAVVDEFIDLLEARKKEREVDIRVTRKRLGDELFEERRKLKESQGDFSYSL